MSHALLVLPCRIANVASQMFFEPVTRPMLAALSLTKYSHALATHISPLPQEHRHFSVRIPAKDLRV